MKLMVLEVNPFLFVVIVLEAKTVPLPCSSIRNNSSIVEPSVTRPPNGDTRPHNDVFGVHEL
jgi:hypothetical protein